MLANSITVTLQESQCRDKDPEALTRITCPRPCNKLVVKFRFEPRLSSSGTCGLTIQDKGGDRESLTAFLKSPHLCYSHGMLGDEDGGCPSTRAGTKRTSLWEEGWSGASSGWSLVIGNTGLSAL